MDCSLKNHFSKEDTLIVKSIGIILMLIHHLFSDEYFLLKCSFIIPDSMSILFTVSNMCKVCVSIFLFLSGYGLYIGAQQKQDHPSMMQLYRYVTKYVRRLLFSYWWAVIPFVIIGIATGMRSFDTVYGTGLSSVLLAIGDFLGINDWFLLTDHMYNITCWYVSLALFLYLLFPFYYRLLNKSILCFVGINLFLGCIPSDTLFLSEPIWAVPFAVGMICAKTGVLDQIKSQIHQKKPSTIAGSVVLFLGSAYASWNYPLLFDSAFAFAIICVLLTALRFLPSSAVKLFRFLGKHSSNIFMTHTFFFYYFWTDFIYAPRYPILILLLLLMVCLLWSIVLEFVKGKFHQLVKTPNVL